MAVSKWVYRKSDNVFLYGGYFEPTTFDAVTQGLLELTEADRTPNLVTDRFDPVLGIRPATSNELLAAQLATADAQALAGATSRELLATLAALDEKFNPAWGSMTNAQRKADVLALGDRWSFWRQWATRNV